MIDLFPFVVTGVVTGCIYAIAAMGLVLTYRTTGVFKVADQSKATHVLKKAASKTQKSNPNLHRPSTRR